MHSYLVSFLIFLNYIYHIKMPKVISISGNSGAGKTTLSRALGTVLQATVVYWDDFDSISKAPEDYVDWYKRGENYNEWDYPALANVLETLKSNKPIHHPALNHLLEATPFIIFDTGNGRLHQQTAQYIDLSIHMDVSLDVSLSRRLIRDFKANDQSKNDLVEELEYYLEHSRPLFFDDEIKAKADFIINGTLPIEDQIKEIKQYLNVN